MAPSVQKEADAEKTKVKKTKPVSAKRKKSNSGKLIIKKSRGLVGIKCPICFEDIKRDGVSSTKCGHVFCTACLQSAMERKPRCPICRTRIAGQAGYHMLYL